jgi:hypothetical protein
MAFLTVPKIFFIENRLVKNILQMRIMLFIISLVIVENIF